MIGCCAQVRSRRSAASSRFLHDRFNPGCRGNPNRLLNCLPPPPDPDRAGSAAARHATGPRRRAVAPELGHQGPVTLLISPLHSMAACSDWPTVLYVEKLCRRRSKGSTRGRSSFWLIAHVRENGTWSGQAPRRGVDWQFMTLVTWSQSPFSVPFCSMPPMQAWLVLRCGAYNLASARWESAAASWRRTG